jgi:hypothetical protein
MKAMALRYLVFKRRVTKQLGKKRELGCLFKAHPRLDAAYSLWEYSAIVNPRAKTYNPGLRPWLIKRARLIKPAKKNQIARE